MSYRFGKTVVIALGGSVMYPEDIDWQFLRRFRAFVRGFARQGTRFVIVTGGGRLARTFQEAAGKIARVTDEDKDWLGIHATRANAHLLRSVFREVADPTVIDTREKVRRPRYAVTVASGWRPGWSTDYIALRIAADLGLKEAVIAGKPDRVYDKDFTKHKNAKAYSEMSWREYRRLVPSKWKPGLHAPVDPIGAKLAHKEGLAAIVVSGKNLKNLGELLRGREFIGTIIKN